MIDMRVDHCEVALRYVFELAVGRALGLSGEHERFDSCFLVFDFDEFFSDDDEPFLGVAVSFVSGDDAGAWIGVEVNSVSRAAECPFRLREVSSVEVDGGDV